MNDESDERLDLVLTRVVDIPRPLIWKAWTEPEHLMKWWAPVPWETVHCKIDLRPGGMLETTMRSPEGEDFHNVGCYLEVVEHERLVWTDALTGGYRPASVPFMTAVLTLADTKGGTRYTARALHKDLADRQKHEEMGFHEGWGKCLDQLVELLQP